MGDHIPISLHHEISIMEQTIRDEEKVELKAVAVVLRRRCKRGRKYNILCSVRGEFLKVICKILYQYCPVLLEMRVKPHLKERPQDIPERFKLHL